MRRKLRRFSAVAAIFGAGGMLMQTSNFACESFAGESLFTAVDTCFIFDCAGGAFGGIVQLCGVGLNPNPTDPLGSGPLLADCIPGVSNGTVLGP